MFSKSSKIKSLQKKLQLLMQERLTNNPSDAVLQKEIKLHRQLAELHKKCCFNAKFPNAELEMVESYRAAASLHDSESQYQLGDHFLVRGKYWQTFIESLYKQPIHEVYAKRAFDEAFASLQAANEQGHPLAKRLLGMAYIHGWGCNRDKNKGFQMVVESIKLENTWNKATEIFTELGLNKPEFFEMLNR